MTRLPVLAIAFEAYASFWRERRRLAALALPGIVVLTAIALLIWWVQTVHMARPAGLHLPRGTFDALLVFGLLALNLVAKAVVVVSFLLACHRLYLKGDRSPVRDCYQWEGRKTRYLVRILDVFGCTLLAGFFAAVLAYWADTVFGAGTVPGIFRLIWVMGAALFVWLKLTTLFSAASVDNPLLLREAWKATHGNATRLFVTVILIELPVGAAIWAGSRIAEMHPGGILAGGTLTGELIGNLASQTVGFFGLALYAFAVSIAYKRLLESGAILPPLDGPTPLHPEAWRHRRLD